MKQHNVLQPYSYFGCFKSRAQRRSKRSIFCF